MKNFAHIPQALRVLAPAGGFASPLSIFNAWRILKQTLPNNRGNAIACFEQYLSEHLDSVPLLAFGSGKQALYCLFKALREKTEKSLVAMSAYTCPDIACAAIRAGLKVQLLDVNPLTLEIDSKSFEEIEENKLCAVVLSNLYGLVDSLVSLEELSRRTGCAIVDDGCQAALSWSDFERVGMRSGCFGVISFGRGKAFCGIGGASLILPGEKAEENGLSLEVFEELRRVECHDVGIGSFLDYLKGFLMWLLEYPALYKIPSSLPFLGLGKTECQLEFSNTLPSQAMLLHALSQLVGEDERSQVCVKNAKSWHQLLAKSEIIEPFIERGFSFDGKVIPIRYPLIFNNKEERNRAYSRLVGAGIGASLSYPKMIGEFAELSESLHFIECPSARTVAERILTLPVHRHVMARDIEVGAKIISETLGGEGESRVC